MKRMRIALLLVAVVCAAVSTSLAGGLWDSSKLKYPPLHEVKLPDVQRSVLPNGMVLYILEDHDFPVVQGRVLLRASSALDPPDKVGLAEMTGDVLRTGGSKTYPGDDLDRKLENMGASLEFNIGSTNGSGNFWCLRENAQEVLTILADLMQNPTFPDEKIELAKVDQRRAIAGRNDEPMDIVRRSIGQVVFGKDHPYARMAEYATIEAITRDDLVAFHKVNFAPDKIYLVITGDFDAAQVKSQVESLFGNWKAARRLAQAEPPATPLVPGGGIYYAEKKGMTNTWIVGGHVGIKADNPDYAAMTVLGEIFGGGFSSRLFNEIRTKRGLAYAAGGTSGTDIPRPGVFFGYSGTRSDSALVALRIIKKEVRRLTEEPVSAAELDLAKNSILNSYVFQYASKAQIVGRMAYLDFFGYPADFTAKYPEEVKKVTAESILAAAKRNIHPDDMQILIVGDQKDFAEPLASLGDVQTFDLTIPEPPAKVVIPAATPENLAAGKALVARGAKATGGSASWASVKSVASKSDMAVSIQGMSLTVGIQSIRTSDNKDYVSQKLPFGEVVMARTGDTGWTKSPKGVEDMAPDDIADLLKERARDFWSIFGRPDTYTAQALPQETVDGKALDVVLLTGGGLDQAFLLLDPTSGLPVQLRYRGKAPTGGPAEVTEVYGDFRKAGSVMVPYSVQTLFDGEPFGVAKVKEAIVNGPIDAKVFAKPE